MEKKYSFRPSSRHILTIGEDLIQDKYAALIELVKNSYDADSTEVFIEFYKNDNKIIIRDNGHGMSRIDVLSKWLVPSTDYKINKRTSPNGRIMQGRKGIGRYSSSLLGNLLELETIDEEGELTTLQLDWNEFKEAKYLDEVKFEVHTKKTNKKSGTIFRIIDNCSNSKDWSAKNLDKLEFELKKLIPSDTIESFNIYINIYEDSKSNMITKEIEPFPIVELYDYRISGEIDDNGNGILYFENQKDKSSEKEIIHVSYGKTECGKIKYDFRVYDRDKESIEELINRGLGDSSTGEYMGKLETRQLLNKINGIGVYRNGFRIRPLGDAGFDWLRLNEKRVQNPSMRIGSNQVVGYVHIESEEKSNLEEKSARDGLKENQAYEKLKSISELVITELEKRRFSYRRNSSNNKKENNLEHKFINLLDYSNLNMKIMKELENQKIPKEIIKNVEEAIIEEQVVKNKVIEEIQNIVAIYQNQATIGNIIDIVLHEGRRPLNYIKNNIINLDFYIDKYYTEKDEKNLNNILRISRGISDNSDSFVKMFEKLDPLATKKRSKAKKFNLLKALMKARDLYLSELDKEKIIFELDCDDSIMFYGWEQDIITILANLIDNSIYWLKDINEKKIEIICKNKEKIYIDYYDTGSGISEDALEDGLIFEPNYTTKSSGMGLGLAIAGEASKRNNLKLKAISNHKGAHFVIEEVKTIE